MTGKEHQAIMSAGWSYRSNDRGWIIYRDPKTGLWHPRVDAFAIIEHAEAPLVCDASAD